MKFRFDYEGHKQVSEFGEKKTILYEIVSNQEQYKKPSDLENALQNFFIGIFLERLDMGRDNRSDQFTRYAKLEEELIEFLKSDNDSYNQYIKNINIDGLALLHDKQVNENEIDTVFNEKYIKALSKLPNDKFKHLLTVYNNDINDKSNCYRYNNQRNKFIIRELKEAQSKRGVFRKIIDFFTGRKKDEDSIIKEMEDKIKADEESILDNGIIRFKDDDNSELLNKMNSEFKEKTNSLENNKKKDEIVYNKAFSLDDNYLFDTNTMGKASADLMESGRICFSSYEPQTQENYYAIVNRLGKVFEAYNRKMFQMEEKGYDENAHKEYQKFLTKCCEALCIDNEYTKMLLKGKSNPTKILLSHGNFEKWCNDLTNASKYLDNKFKSNEYTFDKYF